MKLNIRINLKLFGIEYDYKIGDKVFILIPRIIDGKEFNVVEEVIYNGPYSFNYKYIYTNFVYKDSSKLTRINKYPHEELQGSFSSLTNSKTHYKRIYKFTGNTYDDCCNKNKFEVVSNFISLRQYQLTTKLIDKVNNLFKSNDLNLNIDLVSEQKLIDELINTTVKEIDFNNEVFESKKKLIKEEHERIISNLKFYEKKLEYNLKDEREKLRIEASIKKDAIYKEINKSVAELESNYNNIIAEKVKNYENTYKNNIKQNTLNYLTSICKMNRYYLQLNNIIEINYNIVDDKFQFKEKN